MSGEGRLSGQGRAGVPAAGQEAAASAPANGSTSGAGGSAGRPAPRRGRIWIILVMLAFAVAIFAGIVEIATQEPVEEGPIKLQGVAESQRIFGGLRQQGDRVGDPNAPVTLQLFTDMQCVECADQFLGTVPSLVDRYVRQGEAQLLYRHYSFSRSSVEQGFLGAEAAAAQSYLWQYVYIFFASLHEAERLGVDEAYLRDIAASVPEMDVLLWEQDFEEALDPDSEVMERLAAQGQLARGMGLRAQPSAVVTGPGGTETLQDSPTLEQIEAAIDRVS